MNRLHHLIDFPSYQVPAYQTHGNRDYEDDKPSISLTGFPGAMGDVYTPPSGTGVGNANLRDFDARRRFAKFGSRLVELQRVRQAREALGRKSERENGAGVEFLIQQERERLGQIRVKRQFWVIPQQRVKT